MIAIFLLYNYVVAIMYGTRVISMLTARAVPKEMQGLEDLLLPEFEEVRYGSMWVEVPLYTYLEISRRIWVQERGFAHSLIKGHPAYAKIEHKIDFYNVSLKRSDELAHDFKRMQVIGFYE